MTTSKRRKKYGLNVYCKDSAMDGYDCCWGAFDEINDEIFDTAEEAEKAAIEFIDNCGAWDYEIIEIENEASE